MRFLKIPEMTNGVWRFDSFHSRQHALLVGIYDMYSGLYAKKTNTDTIKAKTMKLSHVFLFMPFML